MKEKERVALIREGNALFNQGKIKEASQIFKSTVYKDGLIRVGDYYFYDKNQPLIAVGYYQLGGAKEKVEEIRERMIFALKTLIKQDDGEKTSAPPKQNENAQDSIPSKSKPKNEEKNP